MTPAPQEPVGDAEPTDLDEFAANHVIRRDGFCRGCGRYPAVKGDPCPVVAVAALAAEKAAHAETQTLADDAGERINRLYGRVHVAEAARDQALAERDRLRGALETIADWHINKATKEFAERALGTTPAEHVEPT